jgi:hypothetical protein
MTNDVLTVLMAVRADAVVAGAIPLAPLLKSGAGAARRAFHAPRGTKPWYCTVLPFLCK